MTEEILDDVERMIDPRPNLGPGPLDGDQQILDGAVAHPLNLAAHDGHLPLHGLALHLDALLYARVACVAKPMVFVAMQQGACLRHVGLVGCCAHHAVYQP